LNQEGTQNVGTATFKERGRLKKRLNNRLRADGVWDAYNELRAMLKQGGVDESSAWLVAAFPFPPKDGSAAEIVDHPLYSEIAAGWENGKYELPDPSQTVSNSDTGDLEAALLKPAQQRAAWQRLAAAVGSRAASELEETRWVVANYLVDVSLISPDDVPSAASLSILMWMQMSPSNFGEFLRTNHSKLLPDRKTVEAESRFKDSGQDLALLHDFAEAIEEEGLSLARDLYLSLDTDKQNQFKQIIQAIEQVTERLSEFLSSGELELSANGPHGYRLPIHIPRLSAQFAAWDNASTLNVESN
jgi:hypothetical protein